MHQVWLQVRQLLWTQCWCCSCDHSPVLLPPQWWSHSSGKKVEGHCGNSHHRWWMCGGQRGLSPGQRWHEGRGAAGEDRADGWIHLARCTSHRVHLVMCEAHEVSEAFSGTQVIRVTEQLFKHIHRSIRVLAWVTARHDSLNPKALSSHRLKLKYIQFTSHTTRSEATRCFHVWLICWLIVSN